MKIAGISMMVLIFLVAAIASGTETAVQFPTTDGLDLSATLTLPATTRPVGGWPALVLIQGSGPTDRDGNSRLIPGVKIDLLKQIAAALAEEGIATLRFDKRGMYANRKQMPDDPSKLAEFFDWGRFVDDSVAAYQFLNVQPGIDPTRVGILGHSEGGTLALVTADRLKSDAHPPAVLILIGTMGRTEDLVIVDQLKSLMAKQGATDAQAKKILDANARITATIKQTGKVPDDVPRGLAALYPAYLGPFLKGSLSVDDAELAVSFPRPVLVMNGEKDIQVSPKLDGAVLDEALKKRKHDDHRFVLVGAASHNLKHVDGDADPGFAGPVDESALKEIRTFCRQKMISPG
jgi:dienelactone hydrolase